MINTPQHHPINQPQPFPLLSPHKSQLNQPQNSNIEELKQINNNKPNSWTSSKTKKVSQKKKNNSTNDSSQKIKKSAQKINDSTYKMNDSTIKINDFAPKMKQSIGSLQEINLFEIGECNKSQRQVLLEKQKWYAESIRQKNRASQQKSRAKKMTQNTNDIFNISLNSSPKKQLTLQNTLSELHGNQKGIEKYFLQSQTVSKVFRQTNLNKLNQTDHTSNTLFSPNSKGHSSKLIQEMNTAFYQNGDPYLHTVSDKNSKYFDQKHGFNGQGCTPRRKSNNKQNVVVLPNPVSNKKGLKSGSYAQIFDKKNTINVMMSHKGKKGVSSSVSRQMGLIKRQVNALNCMGSVQNVFGCQLSCEASSELRDSKQLRNGVEDLGFSVNVSGFAVQQLEVCREGSNDGIEGLSEKTEGISRIEEAVSQNQIHSPTSLNNTSLNDSQLNDSHLTSKLNIHSNLISQIIHHSAAYKEARKQEQQEMALLTKQNSTFKRELTSFRKQNSSLRKQLEHNKNYIRQLEQRARSLLEQQQKARALGEQHKICIQNQSKVQCLLGQASKKELFLDQAELQRCNLHSVKQDDLQKDIFQSRQNSLGQILEAKEKEVFGLKSCNKALELKVYMLEKRLDHETEVGKKRLASQVSGWRERYNKLRNQHLKAKKSLFLNSESSFSLDISSEE